MESLTVLTTKAKAISALYAPEQDEDIRHSPLDKKLACRKHAMFRIRVHGCVSGVTPPRVPTAVAHDDKVLTMPFAEHGQP